MSDLWVTASADAESEHLHRHVTSARVAAATVWPFLAAAVSPEDYANRKALAADRIERVAAAASENDPALFGVVHASLLDGFDQDFTVLHTERVAARVIAETKSRKQAAHEASVRARVQAETVRRVMAAEAKVCEYCTTAREGVTATGCACKKAEKGDFLLCPSCKSDHMQNVHDKTARKQAAGLENLGEDKAKPFGEGDGGKDGDSDEMPDFIKDKIEDKSAKTASTYCPNHGVYVGEGNSEQHNECTKEQRKSADSSLHTAITEQAREMRKFQDAANKECAICGGKANPLAHNLHQVQPEDGHTYKAKTSSRRTAAVPEGAGARDFSPEQTIAQISRMTILAISGGRVNPIFDGSRVVGISLPISQGYAVEIYLGNDDLYIVQRTFRGRVKGEQRGVYADDLDEVAYQAHAYQSNDFGGHTASKTAGNRPGDACPGRDAQPGAAHVFEKKNGEDICVFCQQRKDTSAKESAKTAGENPFATKKPADNADAGAPDAEQTDSTSWTCPNCQGTDAYTQGGKELAEALKASEPIKCGSCQQVDSSGGQAPAAPAQTPQPGTPATASRQGTGRRRPFGRQANTAWDYGIDPTRGDGQVYSCSKSMTCNVTGNAAAMEAHYKADHTPVTQEFKEKIADAIERGLNRSSSKTAAGTYTVSSACAKGGSGLCDGCDCPCHATTGAGEFADVSGGGLTGYIDSTTFPDDAAGAKAWHDGMYAAIAAYDPYAARDVTPFGGYDVTITGRRKTAANPYEPVSNPYTNDPPITPGTPDDTLDGPRDVNPLSTMQAPVTTRPRQQPSGAPAEMTNRSAPQGVQQGFASLRTLAAQQMCTWGWSPENGSGSCSNPALPDKDICAVHAKQVEKKKDA